MATAAVVLSRAADTVGAADGAMASAGNPDAPNPCVHSEQAGAVPHRLGVGQHVLGGHRVAAQESVGPHSAELMDGGEGADGGAIGHLDVAGQGGRVGEDGVVPHPAIVSHVGVGHEQVVGADLRDSAAQSGPRLHGDVLPDHVAIADGEPGVLAVVLEVLGTMPQGGKGEHVVVPAQSGVAVDHHMDSRTVRAPSRPWVRSQ